MQIEIAIAVVFGAWLLGLSALVFLLLRFFNRLVRGTKEGNLKNVLEKILSAQFKNTDEIALLQKQSRRLEEEGKDHIQKIGLVRFNPFSEMGGSSSFCLALLDNEDTGMIITVLHTRERTRVYAKSVKNGESELTLSGEEKKTLLKAMKS